MPGHEWVRLAFVRRGWLNLDLVCALALIVTGFPLRSSGLAAGGVALSSSMLGT